MISNICNVDCNFKFSSISIIISSILVMIGHVIEIRHVLICCAYIRGFFDGQNYINTVVDVDWVCLATDRKAWKAPLNVVMSIQVV